MSGIQVLALSDGLKFGARVRGVTHATLANASVRDELVALFERCGLIVFEGVVPSGAMQVAISTVFGPLKDHPTKTTVRADEDIGEGVIDMHYKPVAGDVASGEALVEINGQLLARFSPWHFDHCYNDELNRAGVLRAPINAPIGGRTGFMDGIELYRRLSPALREAIEGRNVIYTLDTRLSKMKYGVNFRSMTEHLSTPQLLLEAARFPRAMHPAVWTRKSGEKVMHFGPWMAVGIEHDESAEGDALLDAIGHEMNALAGSACTYWHNWKSTDMVIWDNWRMLHAVEGCDAQYERRTLRTTIKGDYGLGYFEDGKKVGEVLREIA